MSLVNGVCAGTGRSGEALIAHHVEPREVLTGWRDHDWLLIREQPQEPALHMALTTLERGPATGMGSGPQRKGSILAGWLSSTDHKAIGHLGGMGSG